LRDQGLQLLAPGVEGGKLLTCVNQRGRIISRLRSSA
jgi:hypothetical protein